ncbi:MAG: 50S ribosomal protein L10 [Aeropyrum sp.]|nr:50S ribosomal protein L10 [Aeropyrum sp.]MCE4616114.1 50S ribosomal protein L10 [Aeropyrum sp.]
MSLVGATYKREKGIPEWKIQAVKELSELFRRRGVVIFADLTGTPTFVVQRVRKKLWKKYPMRVAKKRIIIRAIREAGIDIDEGKLDEMLSGQTLLVFAEGNPFKVVKEIESERVAMPVKPGDVAESEIRIPEGMTNLTPGPILSVFGKLRIQYQVRGGKIYIAKETVVAKPGDTISEDLAGLLMALGIRPIEKGVRVKFALDGGILIPEDMLRPDIEAFTTDLASAAREAIGLATEIVYLPVPEALEGALAIAARAASLLAGEIGFIAPGTVEDVIRRAIAEELAVVSALGDKAAELGLEEAPAQAPEQAEEKAEEEKKEEEEEKKEEEELGGLDTIFGGF